MKLDFTGVEHEEKFLSAVLVHIVNMQLDTGFDDIWMWILPHMWGHWLHGGQIPVHAPTCAWMGRSGALLW